MSAVAYNYSNDFATMNPNLIKLNDNNIGAFAVAKEFRENKARINSIDFSQDGKTLITSSDDDTIIVYDCQTGTKSRDIMSKKYGVDLIHNTHASNTAIHTSTKENHIIRYLSLHDNKYLRYFIGHTETVVTLSMSPADDSFLSGSLDKTVRLWDLKSDKCCGIIPVTGFPSANYDPEGLIFAIGQESSIVRLFDSRHYQKGPFNTIRTSYKPPDDIVWTSLKFSPNGKQILISTNKEEFYVLDAFSGQPLHRLTMGPELTGILEHPCHASYSPDSQFIICGSVDGSIHVWSSMTGLKVSHLRPRNSSADAVQCVQFNPKYMMIASASKSMSFWIPTITES